mgnify:CR=1 FL=1
MVLRLMGKEYYESKNVEDALSKGKRIEYYDETIKFVRSIKRKRQAGEIP